MALDETDIEPIRRFLRAPTPPGWVAAAVDDLPVLLNDHANCELKAASTALGLIYRYPERGELCARMSRLAREELRHFEQVRKMMSDLSIPFERLSASRYAAAMHEAVRSAEPERLVDSLSVGAIIEARSCERFAALVPELESPLKRFYSGLLASEARHFEHYLGFARDYADEAGIALRVDEMLDLDARLVAGTDEQFRFHSGAPPQIA